MYELPRLRGKRVFWGRELETMPSDAYILAFPRAVDTRAVPRPTYPDARLFFLTGHTRQELRDLALVLCASRVRYGKGARINRGVSLSLALPRPDRAHTRLRPGKPPRARTYRFDQVGLLVLQNREPLSWVTWEGRAERCGRMSEKQT